MGVGGYGCSVGGCDGVFGWVVGWGGCGGFGGWWLGALDYGSESLAFKASTDGQLTMSDLRFFHPGILALMGFSPYKLLLMVTPRYLASCTSWGISPHMV